MSRVNIEIQEEARARQSNAGAANREAEAVNRSNEAKNRGSQSTKGLVASIKTLIATSEKRFSQMKNEMRLLNLNYQAYQKMTAKQKEAHTGMADITNGGRLLNNSFATMRSKLLLLSFGYTMFAQKVFDLVDAYGEQEAAEGRLAQSLKNSQGATGISQGALQKYAVQIQEATGISDEMTISSMALLSTFHNIGGKEFLRATELIGDLTIAYNGGKVSTELLKSETIRLGKALNDPIQGLGMLKKVGIDFSKSQIEVIKSLQESGRLMEAQSLILDIIEGQYQDNAGRDSYQKSIRALASAWGDFQEKMGKELMPTLKKLAEQLTKILKTLDVDTIKRWAGSLLMAWGVIKGFKLVSWIVQIKASGKAWSMVGKELLTVARNTKLVKSVGKGLLFGAISYGISKAWTALSGGEGSKHMVKTWKELNDESELYQISLDGLSESELKMSKQKQNSAVRELEMAKDYFDMIELEMSNKRIEFSELNVIGAMGISLVHGMGVELDRLHIDIAEGYEDITDVQKIAIDNTETIEDINKDIRRQLKTARKDLDYTERQLKAQVYIMNELNVAWVGQAEKISKVAQGLKGNNQNLLLSLMYAKEEVSSARDRMKIIESFNSLSNEYVQDLIRVVDSTEAAKQNLAEWLKLEKEIEKSITHRANARKQEEAQILSNFSDAKQFLLEIEDIQGGTNKAGEFAHEKRLQEFEEHYTMIKDLVTEEENHLSVLNDQKVTISNIVDNMGGFKDFVVSLKEETDKTMKPVADNLREAFSLDPDAEVSYVQLFNRLRTLIEDKSDFGDIDILNVKEVRNMLKTMTGPEIWEANERSNSLGDALVSLMGAAEALGPEFLQLLDDVHSGNIEFKEFDVRIQDLIASMDEEIDLTEMNIDKNQSLAESYKELYDQIGQFDWKEYNKILRDQKELDSSTQLKDELYLLKEKQEYGNGVAESLGRQLSVARELYGNNKDAVTVIAMLNKEYKGYVGVLAEMQEIKEQEKLDSAVKRLEDQMFLTESSITMGSYELDLLKQKLSIGRELYGKDLDAIDVIAKLEHYNWEYIETLEQRVYLEKLLATESQVDAMNKDLQDKIYLQSLDTDQTRELHQEQTALLQVARELYGIEEDAIDVIARLTHEHGDYVEAVRASIEVEKTDIAGEKIKELKQQVYFTEIRNRIEKEYASNVAAKLIDRQSQALGMLNALNLSYEEGIDPLDTLATYNSELAEAIAEAFPEILAEASAIEKAREAAEHRLAVMEHTIALTKKDKDTAQNKLKVDEEAYNILKDQGIEGLNLANAMEHLEKVDKVYYDTLQKILKLENERIAQDKADKVKERTLAIKDQNAALKYQLDMQYNLGDSWDSRNQILGEAFNLVRSLTDKQFDYGDSLKELSSLDHKAYEELVKKLDLLKKIKKAERDAYASDVVEDYKVKLKDLGFENTLLFKNSGLSLDTHEKMRDTYKNLTGETVSLADGVRLLKEQYGDVYDSIEEYQAKLEELAARQKMIDNIYGAYDELNNFLESQLSAEISLLDQRKDAEIERVKETSAYKVAAAKGDKDKMKKMEQEAAKDFIARQKKLFKYQQGLAVAGVVIDFMQAHAKEMSKGVINYLIASPFLAMQQALKIGTILAQKPPAYALGGDFITNGPEYIQVGDNAGGRERVQITPLSSPNINGPAGGEQNINITFSGNVLSDDFIEETAIPKIYEAIRRGSNIGIG